jgi:hypothetical protein
VRLSGGKDKLGRITRQGDGYLNVAAVALAAKHARIAWAILAHGTDYRPAGPEAVAA